MADLTPTYYNLDYASEMGIKSQADIIKGLYNCWKAIAAICNNLDEDNGTLGTDYLSKIGTDLNTAMGNLSTPNSGGTT